MTTAPQEQATTRWPLLEKTAADLMHPNPVSIRDSATAEEALVFLADTTFSAAPVINEAGHPVGVLSRSDLLVHERELALRLSTGSTEQGRGRSGSPAVLSPADTALVRDLMTPIVLAVAPEMSADDVLGQMVDQNVHRLFVVDRTGVLIGVISSVDLLRHLRL